MGRRARRSFGVLAVACAALAPACERSDSIVVVKVAADSDVTDVVQLRAWVSNAGDGTARLFPTAPAAQPIAFETSFSLSVPRARTGALDIALDGLDGGGSVIASGAGTVDLHVGDNVTVTITLSAGPSLCGNGQLDSGEGCDDGDRLSKGTCDYVCQPRTAGPGAGGAGGAAGTGGTGGTGGSAGSGATAGTGGTSGTGGNAGTGGAAGSGGRPCMMELLTNGGFDSGNPPWMQVTDLRPLIWNQMNTPITAQSPTRLAWLGEDAHGEEPALRQTVQIPPDAVQVNISGYYRITTDEGDCDCDQAYVELERPGPDGGVITTELLDWNNEDENSSWMPFSTFVNGAAIAGQSVTLQLHVVMDDGVNTSFYFDSLSVVADVCP
jgi:hypothetical protein